MISVRLWFLSGGVFIGVLATIAFQRLQVYREGRSVLSRAGSGTALCEVDQLLIARIDNPVADRDERLTVIFDTQSAEAVAMLYRNPRSGQLESSHLAYPKSENSICASVFRDTSGAARRAVLAAHVMQAGRAVERESAFDRNADGILDQLVIPDRGTAVSLLRTGEAEWVRGRLNDKIWHVRINGTWTEVVLRMGGYWERVGATTHPASMSSTIERE
ncbi:MAG: hypothetical protein U1A27_03680 [Phycisphaerae bacterium]